MKLSITLQIVVLLFLSACQTKVEKEKEVAINIEIESVYSPVKSSIRGISIVDTNTAWLSGAKGTILRSLNQGKSWNIVPSPDFDSLDFRSIHAFSEISAIVASAGFPARIYKTTNAGLNWNLVYENLDSNAFINSISFKNKNEGIILGDQISGRHLILRTGNAGNTWTRIDSMSVPKPLKMENGFAASGSCIAISKSGRYFIGLGGEEARVFSSVNGYKWKVKKTPLVHGAASAGIYSIAASGNGKIMAVGGDYTKADSSHFPIISKNDGKSWIKTKGKVSGYRSVIDYSSKSKVWVAAGSNGLDFSFDDGDSWSKFSGESINTLRFFPNSSKGLAANSNGEIYIVRINLSKRKI